MQPDGSSVVRHKVLARDSPIGSAVCQFWVAGCAVRRVRGKVTYDNMRLRPCNDLGVFKISWGDPYGNEMGRRRNVAMWREIARITVRLSSRRSLVPIRPTQTNFEYTPTI